MTVVSEAAQASMRYWRPAETTGERSIFLEVYVEHKKPSLYSRVTRCKLCRCGRRRKRDKKDMYTRHQTQPVPEAREMRWRSYNEDMFLVALFSLGGTDWVMRHGDEVALAADVYRIELDHNSTTKVHTLRGNFRVGSWGSVILRSRDALQDHQAQFPEVILEMRPMSARPFNSEFARPRERWDTIEDIFIRQSAERLRITSMSLGKRESLGMGFRSTLSLFRTTLSSGGFTFKLSHETRLGRLKDKALARLMGRRHRRKRNLPGNRLSDTGSRSSETKETSWQQAVSDEIKVRENGGDPSLGTAATPYYSSEDSTMTDCSADTYENQTPTRSKNPWKGFSNLKNTGTLFDRANNGSEKSKLPSVDEDREAREDQMMHQVSERSNRSERADSDFRSENNRSEGDEQAEPLSPVSFRNKAFARGECSPSSPTSPFASLKSRFEPTFSTKTCDNAKEEKKRKLQILIGQRTSLRKKRRHSSSSSSSLSAQDKREWNDWRPTDWQNLWKSSWPGRSDRLPEGTQVVPLMEVEFRKDCIIIFNTLFPRVQTEGFQTLRNLALELNSKIQWKPARYRRQTSRLMGETLLGEDGRGRGPAPDASDSPIRGESPSGKNLRRGDSVESIKTLTSELCSLSSCSVDGDVLSRSVDNDSVASLQQEDETRPIRPRTRWYWGPLLALKRVLANFKFRRRSGQPGSPALNYLADPNLSGSLTFSPPGSLPLELEGRTRLSIHQSHLLCMMEDPGDKLINTSDLALDVRSEPLAASKGSRPAAKLEVKSSDNSTASATELTDGFCSTDSIEFLASPSGKGAAEKSIDSQESRDLDVALSLMSPVQASIDPASTLSGMLGTGSQSCSASTEGDNPSPNGEKAGDTSPSSKLVLSDSCALITPMIEQKRREARDGTKFPDCTSSASTASLNTDAIASPVRSTSQLVQGPFVREQLWGLPTKIGVLQDEYSPRIMFLKRLLIVFAVCGVYYTEDGNSMQLGDLWPYPVAAILGHGARILVRLEDVEGAEFINFLLFGDPYRVDWRVHGVPVPLKRRIAATHAVEIERETGHLIEKKLKVLNAADSVQNISDGIIKRKHLGINLPIGGVGNMSPLGKDHLIEFTGKVVARRGENRKQQLKRALSNRSLKSRSTTGSEKTGFEALQEEAALACSIGPTMTRQSSMSSFTSASSTRSETVSSTWKPIPHVQHGHLYMRIDDFGEQYSCPCWLEGSATRKGKYEEIRRFLRSGEPVDVRLSPFFSNAGDLMSSPGVSLPGAKAHSKIDPRIRLRDATSGPRLIRVSSEPILDRRNKFISEEDVAWVENCISSPNNQRLKVPPSAEALRLLLERLDPLSTRLYGTGQFKTIEDFHHELLSTPCFLVKKNESLRRCVEQVALKLKWKGQTLMQTHEIDEKNTNIRKSGILSARLKQTDDRLSIVKDLVDCLGVPQAIVEEAWDRCNCLQYTSETSHDSDSSRYQSCAIMEQKVASSSYPGIISVHTTHMVTWDVLHEGQELWRNLGLPPSEKTRAHNVNRADITAARETSTGFRIHCWRWVPEAELHRFREIQTADEAVQSTRNQWVSYALGKEGPLQCPPTENALLELFGRCGMEFYQYDNEQTRQVVRALWLELASQECFLQMSGGRPIRVVEAMLVRVRWRSSKLRPWQMLVQTHVESLELLRDAQRKSKVQGAENDESPKHSGKQLLRSHKFKDEKWEECALRCINDKVNLSPQQVRSVLDHKPGDVSAYTFYEKERESEKFPGLQTLYRTHLVTYTLKEDAPNSPAGRFFLGCPEDMHKTAARKRWSAFSMPNDAPIVVSPAGMDLQAAVEERQLSPPTPLSPGSTSEANLEPKTSLEPGREVIAVSDLARTHFEWLLEEEVMHTVAGGTLWSEASKNRERHRVSSVLIGLEGSAPNFKSPFGGSHDASGEPNKVSALGGRKWRAYRTNNAWQIPADEGGMRIQITRQTISELIDTCNSLDLVDPSSDITGEGVIPRDMINQRHAEQEMFKQILMGNCCQAKKALEDMLEYRSTEKTLGQAYLAITSQMRRR